MYKLRFTETELNKFNIIENEKIRKSAMSIYMYMMKLNENKNEKYSEAGLDHLVDTEKLSVSMTKFLKAYNRNHNKISIRTLKNRIDLLEELQLVSIDKTGKTNTYNFNRNKVNEKVNDTVNNEEVAEHVENTSVTTTSEEPKYLNTKKDIKNNINNSLSDAYPSKIFVNSIEEIKDKLDYLLDKFSITSQSAVKETYRRINKVISTGTLRFKGAEKYIISTISSIKDSFIPSLIRQAKKKNKDVSEPVSGFCDYEQRSYNYNKLETMLLGWNGNDNLRLEDCYE